MFSLSKEYFIIADDNIYSDRNAQKRFFGQNRGDMFFTGFTGWLQRRVAVLLPAITIFDILVHNLHFANRFKDIVRCIFFEFYATAFFELA